MKLDEWGKLLISWANFLDPNENIGKTEELCSSGLFPRLLKVLQNADDINTDDYFHYLQEQYSSLDFSGQRNREVAVLQATAFLIYCSLHHPNNDLQQKMIDLPYQTQCQFTDFLQEFVDVPKTKITRELIFSKISQMSNVSALEGQTVRTPPNFGTPVTYTSSPSTEEIMGPKTNSSTKKTSRLKKLRRDIDALTSMQMELTEELDSAKECIAKLECEIKKKDVEITKLKLEIKETDGVEHVCEVHKTNDDFKVEKLKVTIEKLEHQKSELEDNVIQLTSQKNGIYEELKNSKIIIQKAEVQRKLSDDVRAGLEKEILTLKSAIEELTTTINEQSDYIVELTRAKDDSKCFSDSQSESVILPESLGQHVIDLQVRELQEDLERKETEITDLKSNIGDLSRILEEKLETIEKQNSLLKCKDAELLHKTSQIKYLDESLSKVNCELGTSQEDYQKLECEINKIKEEFKVCLDMMVIVKSEKEKLEDSMNEKLEIIKLRENEINNLMEGTKEKDEEISLLKASVEEVQYTLNNAQKANKEEIDRKNDQIKILEETISAWVDRNMELNNLLENLTGEMEEKNLRIKNNETDLRNVECQNLFLTNTLQEKDSIINSMQASINSMTDEINSLNHKESSLLAELKSSNSHILQLKSQISDLNELLNSCISEKNTNLKIIVDKETTIRQQIDKLKDMKTDFEARKRKLECDLEQKEKEYKEAEEDRYRLNIDLDDLKHKFLFLEIKMKEKEKELLDNSYLVEKLEADLKISFEKEVNLTCKIEEYENNIASAEQELDSSKTAVSELQKEISQLLSEAEEHSREEFKLKNQISASNEIINDLMTKLNEGEVKRKEQEEASFIEKESMKSVIEKLKLSLVKLNEEISVHNEMNDTLAKDLTERNETIKNLENDIKTLQSELLSLKEEKHTLINDTLSKGIAVEELEDKLIFHKTEINTLLMEKEEMSLEFEKLKEEYDTKVQAAKNLQVKLSEYVLRVNDLADKLVSKDSLIIQLKKDLDELKCLQMNIDDIREEAHSSILRLKDEIDDLSANKYDMMKELKDKEDSISSLKTTIERKENWMDTIESSNQLLREKLDESESDCFLLKSEVKDLKRKVQKVEKTNQHLTEECENKTKQVNDYSEQLENLLIKSNSEIKKLEENYISEKSTLATEINNLKGDFENLKDEKEKLNVELKTVKMGHSGCEEKILNAENLIMELKDKENCLNNEIDIYKEKEEAFKKEVCNKNSLICDLNNDIDCLKRLVSTYEFQEGNLNTKLQAKEGEIIELNSNLSDLVKQLRTNEDMYEEELKLKYEKIHDLDLTIGKLNSQYIQVSKEKESLIIEIENKKSLEYELKSLKMDNKLLKEAKESLEHETFIRNDEFSQLKLDLNSYEREIQSLKTEFSNQSRVLQDKMKELEEAKSNVIILQNESLDSKMKEKTMMEQLVLYNDMVVSIEQNLLLYDTKFQEAEMEITILKDTLAKKEEQIEGFSRERNCLQIDIDILSKKNGMFVSQLDAMKKEIEELCNKLNKAESEISKLTLHKREQDQTIESLYSTLHSQNVEINEKSGEIETLQKEVKSVIQQLSEERSNKFSQFQKLKAEKDVQETKLKPHMPETDYKDRIEQIKSTYEKKVLALKAIMKKQYTEKLEEITYTLQNENTDLKEKLAQEQERCARLQSELWNASDKLLIAQEQNRTLLTNLQCRNAYEVLRPNEPLSPISKARSMEVLSGRNRGIDNFARDISFNESGSSRRSSIRSLPRGMGKKFSFSAGKVFPAAEEDGEVFDSRYLADLKAGRCDVQYDPDRMSILQYRNSLCPPHLKSSYPAETQFISTAREDDIKIGAASSSGDTEKDVKETELQAGAISVAGNSETDVRKTKVQGGEKTCPSSPRSGHSSYSLSKEQSNEKSVLREPNARRETTKPPKPSTPSRLKALFVHRKDENSPRRKSFFKRS